jgi:hypothetical protein
MRPNGFQERPLAGCIQGRSESSSGSAGGGTSAAGAKWSPLLFKKVKGAGAETPGGFVSGSLEMANGEAIASSGETTGGRHAGTGAVGGFIFP